MQLLNMKDDILSLNLVINNRCQVRGTDIEAFVACLVKWVC